MESPWAPRDQSEHRRTCLWVLKGTGGPKTDHNSPPWPPKKRCRKGPNLCSRAVVWGDIKKMSRSWTANEEMGRWWDDREEEFGAKLDITKACLEEALYGEEHLAEIALSGARRMIGAIHALKGHHKTRSMLSLQFGSATWRERW